VLYQGDLSLEINQLAVLDMLNHWPPDAVFPVVVAGRSGDRKFEEKLTGFPNLTREADVTHEKMIDLIQGAQIILIHSLHGAGMKLKIFPALYHGRFVAATHQSKTNTALDSAIQFYEPASLQKVVQSLWSQDFTAAHRDIRRDILAQHPSDLDQAKEIIRYL
jgi:hypothetical protein